MPNWFKANLDVAKTIFDGMNNDKKNKYYLYTLGEEGKAYIVAWNSMDNDVLISDCENYEDHNKKYSQTEAKKTCRIEEIKKTAKLVEALNSAYGGKKYYNKEKRERLITGKLIANANADDDYGIGLFDSSANSSSSDSGQGSWGTTLGWDQQQQQYQQPQQYQQQQPQSNPYQQSWDDTSEPPPPPPPKKHFATTGGTETFSYKLEQIKAKSIDVKDKKSNKKNQSTEKESSSTDNEDKSGSAIKYACAMINVANYIAGIIKEINSGLNKDELSGHVKGIYDKLAKSLATYGFIIKGFNTSNGSLDSKFNNCSMRKNPSKLNIAAFKAKHPELSDTKRYTQEFIGVIAKYINAIDGIIQCLPKINGYEKKLKKFKDDLEDADAYALKFVSNIVKIKNRKGHRAAITFPCALNEIKKVLEELNDLGDALSSYALQSQNGIMK